MQGTGTARTVQGVFQGVPGQRYQLEVFGNRAANGGDAERLLGTVDAVTDAQGQGHFALTLPATPDIARLTATATSALGATSPLSAPLSLR
ncbi:3-dehydroshikimate dehydratase [compost metagenome]